MENPVAGAESVEVQAHMESITRLGRKGIGEAPAYFVRREDEGFHADIPFSALDCRDHHVVELVALDDKKEGATTLAQLGQADLRTALHDSDLANDTSA